jgi:hypothetical protein
MRGIVAAGLVIAMTALAGCTDEPRPRFEEPTESPAASDSTTSAAAEPEPWEEKSKAGAVAFARHWIDVFNDAQTSGDTYALQQSSSPQCATCAGFIGRLKRLYGDGGRFEGDGWRVLLAAPGPSAITDEAQVNLRIDRPAERIIAGDGRVQRFPGGKSTYSAELVWSDGEWRMARLVQFV